MTKKYFELSKLQYPVLIRAKIGADQIKITTYEEMLVRPGEQMDESRVEESPESLPLIGRMTGKPLGKHFGMRFDFLGKAAAGPATFLPNATTPPSPLKINRSRLLMLGEDLDPRFAGRYFTKISSATLWTGDPGCARDFWQPFGEAVFDMMEDGVVLAPYNPHTLGATDLIPSRIAISRGRRSVAYVVLGADPRNLSEATVTVTTHPDFGVFSPAGLSWSKMNSDDRSTYPSSPSLKWLTPTSALTADSEHVLRFQISSPGSSQSAPVNASMLVETEGGSVPLRKIQIENGVGEVRLRTDHLRAGDTFDLSLRFPHGRLFHRQEIRIGDSVSQSLAKS